jgi:hypothetical protein
VIDVVGAAEGSQLGRILGDPFVADGTCGRSEIELLKAGRDVGLVVVSRTDLILAQGAEVRVHRIGLDLRVDGRRASELARSLEAGEVGVVVATAPYDVE